MTKDIDVEGEWSAAIKKIMLKRELKTLAKPIVTRNKKKICGATKLKQVEQKRSESRHCEDQDILELTLTHRPKVSGRAEEVDT